MSYVELFLRDSLLSPSITQKIAGDVEVCTFMVVILFFLLLLLELLLRSGCLLVFEALFFQISLHKKPNWQMPKVPVWNQSFTFGVNDPKQDALRGIIHHRGQKQGVEFRLSQLLINKVQNF